MRDGDRCANQQKRQLELQGQSRWGEAKDAQLAG
jgi:hypothetical protein